MPALEPDAEPSLQAELQHPPMAETQVEPQPIRQSMPAVAVEIPSPTRVRRQAERL